ncbi:MAG: thioredoxin family protein [Labilithrix sp.]|nr:thioredoxin family protein [Labilithrix sp.]
MAWFHSRAAAVVGFLVGVSALAGTSACGGSKKEPMTPSADGDGKSGPAEVGKSAPDLKVETLNGKGAISLDSLQGKIAVVDFWATWCGPCKQSFPKLEELSKQNQGKVQVVGISVDDKAEGVADFAKANGATFAIGWDDGHTIAGRWKVDTMPTTYILDSTGKVRYIHAGYKDGEADVIQKELATLASESGGSSSAKTSDATDKPSDKPADKPSDTAATDKPADATTATASGDTAADATPPKKGTKKGGKKGGKKPVKKPAAQ